MTEPTPLWTPDVTASEDSNIAWFARSASGRTGLDLSDYDALWRWSVTEPEQFWAEVWHWFGLDAVSSFDVALTSREMPDARWFVGSRLNFAEYLLDQGASDATAIIAVDEAGGRVEISRAELRRQVQCVSSHLLDAGVAPGQVVAGYLPNCAEAVVAFLATALIGATWTSVGQDYAPSAVVDRFAQLGPTLLIAADGYHFNGRPHERLTAIAEIAAALRPEHGVIVKRRLGTAADQGASPWRDWDTVTSRAVASAIPPAAVPFDHPLWVLFSSGTTGIPKGLVHGHGGILLETLKQMSLHWDLRESDRVLWYASPSWVMWNLQVSTLACGGSIVCYDGSPTWPDVSTLWRFVEQEQITFLGASPGYLQACEMAGLAPGRSFDLTALRAMGSTGSPLPPQTHRWATAETGGLPLWSMSGGTDIAGAFVGGSPTVPVWPGELSVRCLGVALEAWDHEGRPTTNQVGEMVITLPLPSMPVFLWGDPDKKRYRDAYLDHYPGTWRQGDWVTVTDRGTVVIHGRSDSTLNRNGVRMGSADIYAAVASVPEVVESLVIGAEQPDGGYWMPLFVVLDDGAELTQDLVDRINGAIRTAASPRHVPDEVIAVSGIPHTRTGKKLEVPVKRILQGHPLSDIVNPDAVDDPTLLQQFAALAAARS